jgi:TonB family protein
VLAGLLGTQPSPSSSSISVVVGGGTAAGTFHLPAILLGIAVLAYATITAWFAARFALRCARLSALRRQSTQFVPTARAARDWEQCAASYGIEHVALATSPQIFGPVTLGLRHKLVLLPAHMADHLPEADLRTVIAHEFAHISRHDFLKNLLYELLSLPVSYHPLFRLTREHIMETREMICDQMAARTAGHNQYAQSLLRLASLLVKGMPVRTPHAIGIFDANTFERRLMKLTGRQNEVHGVRRLALMLACAALGLATCGTALALGLRVDANSAKSSGSTSKTPGRVNVAPGVMAGNILTKVTPVYPVDAKKAGIQGKVTLDAIIGKDGIVENLKVVSGPKELQQSSLDAVRQWTYKPFLLNGNPVEVETTVHVTYTLAK